MTALVTAAAYRARAGVLQAALNAATTARDDFLESQPDPDAVLGGLRGGVDQGRNRSVNRAKLRYATGPRPDAEVRPVVTSTQWAELRGEVALPEHYYDLAVARVNAVTGDAEVPPAVVLEAMIRYAGWLFDAGADPAGEGPNASSAWFRSGAASVLAPWVPRRMA